MSIAAAARQLALASTLAVLLDANTHAATTTVVKLDTGRVRGAASGEVIAFKGIPFAAPPVGALRWRPPQPAASWSGVREATAYGPDCMQVPFPGDAAPLGVPPAEDCLYVNVWTPARPAQHPLPVMVWIYGGGFVNGGSSPGFCSRGA